MTNTSVATAPTTPLTIALVFELPLPDVGVVLPVGPVDMVELPVGLLEVLEAPINTPGPISGLSEERRCENDREKKMDRRIPTTDGHRFIWIPTILQLAYNVSSCRDTQLETYCGVEGSPIRYVYLRGNRVWESMSRLHHQSQCLQQFVATKNSHRSGQNCSAVGHPFRPPDGRYINEDRQRHNGSYVNHLSP